MIHIKTEMKEIPKDCNNCDYMSPTEDMQEPGEQHICTAARRAVRHNGEHTKLPCPIWCPLVEVEDA